MKGATQCARRLKQLFRSLRSRLGKVNRPVPSDPISQLILGVFSRDTQESNAREALEQLRAMVVDYNELRVISPLELAQQIGDYPDIRIKCEDLSRALNRIFAIEHTVSLDRFIGGSRQDALNYLNGLPGLEAYTRARVRLLGLNQHAIPLDEAMWAYARQTEVVDPRCPLEEAQLFLERQIAEPEALEFVALFRKAAWSEMGSAVRKGEVERIRSVPPDRTTRNMLQLIASGSSLSEPSLPLEEPEVDGELGEEPAAEKAGEAGPSRGKSRRPKAAKPKVAKAARKRAQPAAAPAARKGAAAKRSAARPARKARTA